MPLVADMKAPRPVQRSYGLGLATYYLSCGTFYGHGGAINGTHSIAIVTDDGTAGVVVAINLRTMSTQTSSPSPSRSSAHGDCL